LFDMGYGWDRHHTMNKIAEDKKDGAKLWDENMEKDRERYEKDDVLMTFVTNHDENSWNGTIEERMGEAAEVLTALSYVAPGMPLIYSGQEYGLNHRLKFFEKDQIPKTKGKAWSLLQKLGTLKATNSSMHGGKNAASYERLSVSNDNILLFTRSKEGKKLTFMANLSGKEQRINPAFEGAYTNYMTNKKEEYTSEKPITLNPWEYKILLPE